MISSSMQVGAKESKVDGDETPSEFQNTDPLEEASRRAMSEFITRYSSNVAAADALADLIVMPPISAGRELPPDTKELLSRARLGTLTPTLWE